MSNRTLHPHQTASLAGLAASIRAGHRRPILNLPTGGGKTVVASTITRGALVKGNSVLFTVPSRSLIDQTTAMFWSEGINDIGVYQADHPLTNRGARVQVGTLQTVMRRNIDKPGLVMVDECHVNFKFIGEMMERWPDVVFIGLTATPGTKGLGKIWDDLVIPTSTNDLIAAGLLSDSRTFAHSHPDLSGIATVAGDYHEGQLSERMQKPMLVADTVDCLKKFRGGRPTLVFCVDRAHAQVVFEKLCDAGIHAEYVDQYTPREEREQIRQRMERGEVEVTVNIGCLTTGTDWPFISCIVLARPTKSKMLFKQIIGRGLRTYPGKDYCLILDQSDSTQRLGFASDIEWDHLDDGNPNRSAAKKKEPAEPRECIECHALIPPATRACPECGHTFKVISHIRIGKGELTEVKRGEKKQKHTMATKQIWWSGFLHYAAQRNKNRKWCLAQYKQKFGVWPNLMQDIATEPSAEILGWIKSKQIAWAKSQHNSASVEVAS